MDEIRLTSELRRDGFSHDDIARICRQGDLDRVRRGAYSPPLQPGARPEDAHLRMIMASIPQLRGEVVLSHASAAVVHGLPMRAGVLDQVHITRSRHAGGGRQRSFVVTHTSPLPSQDVVELHGLRVTSLARTVADLARTLSIDHAVGAADRAGALGMGRTDLEEVLTRQRGWPGAPRARHLARFVDPKAESVGESISRVRCWQAGLPAPLTQYVVRHRGAEVARCDFCWERPHTLGEFDGKIKYGRLLRPGQSIGQVVYEEKLREDALRDLGWQVVRWTWDDLFARGLIADRVNRAFGRSRSVAA